tara:strand:- start:362 stop:1177 length:816 start_codon:yes stop_codon:yes gene_type:complete
MHRLISYKKKNKKELKHYDFSLVNLEKNGYQILNQSIENKKVTELNKLANKLECFDGYSKKRFDNKNLTSVRYNFDKNDLINDKTVQRLVADEFFISIARRYFDSEPIFDLPAMWWSTAYKKQASSEAAQLYHYDCNGRVKWLKIFIYLTDVDENNGPHYYIQKTHKIGSKPKEILSRGYVRVSDNEMKNIYPEKDFKIVTGKKGTTFVGDTLCWHKGKNLIKGKRLVLELNYTSSLYGLNEGKLTVKKFDKRFKEFCLKNKIYSKNILFV